jgi:diadenosine tetraphosphate (Ap4A) HIT family hydrolase
VDPVDDDRVRGLLALIAGTVSSLHMHLLVELHGQPSWAASLAANVAVAEPTAAGRVIAAWPSFASLF